MKSVSLAATFVLAGILCGCGSNEEIGFYLVKSPPNVNLDTSLDNITLERSPLFSDEDIVSISERDHSISLDSDAFDRFQRAEKTRPIGTGVALCKRGRPIFLAVLWKEICEESTQNIVVRVRYPFDKEPVLPERRVIAIDAGHFTNGYTGRGAGVVAQIFELLLNETRQWKVGKNRGQASNLDRH